MSEPVFDPKPVTLERMRARLRPIATTDLEGLIEAGSDPEVWRWLAGPGFSDRAFAAQWLDEALGEIERGESVVFAIEDRDTGRLVGSTRYMTIRRPHRGLEIGWTWIAPSHQRTSINTECKRLLLGHAFDDLGALRVELKTDDLNERSKTAMLRIGAQFEGVFRGQMIMPDGRVRDSAYFSVTRDDWPEVRARLEERLAQYA